MGISLADHFTQALHLRFSKIGPCPYGLKDCITEMAKNLITYTKTALARFWQWLPALRTELVVVPRQLPRSQHRSCFQISDELLHLHGLKNLRARPTRQPSRSPSASSTP